ncbi:hypothetical protein GCK72_019292 [Caenorhabditis remanei]|uniref:7TM GPCR serpentine receptor class x (Srx) domain-containing protein n=1 Tax=Caenorhabditis remanei TaxID=31234 RepID=A0A6A5GBX2_CAERE|nr:hypothetical protein GCK72_019292 [Caenorhabditis remanei]KAF1752737.1 hypothetical protein GCK72_019292 [Caenorhabditis remanei]
MDFLNFFGSLMVLVIETLIIIITVNVYLVNEFQTILIAVNRFIAMFLPLYYHKLFNNKITLAFLVALYLERGYSSITKLWSLFENNCEVIWGLDRFSIMYYDDSCSVRFPTGFDSPWIVFLPLGFFAVTILLNLMTFAKILRFYLTHNADSESMDSIKNNIRLFFQTVLQDSLFFVDVLFTFKLSSMSTHRLWYFISTVFVWESIHMLDGSSNILPISIETFIIALTINIYMVNSYHCVLIGVNRFIAMFIPFYYAKLFGMKVTMVILTLLYLERIYATIVKLLQEFDNRCRVYISLDSFGPHYEDSTCSKRLKDGFDGILIVLIPLGIFAFTVILNLITFVKIMQFYMGDSLFFVDVLFTFKLSSLSEDRLWFFISQVFVWESIHMLDGGSNFYPDIVETVIITATINVYLVNQLQTVVIALNRFIALFAPFHYKTLCSNQVTWVILGVLYAQRGYETFSKLYDLISKNCLIHLDSESFGNAFNNRNCSNIVSVDSDLIVLMPFIFLSITIVLNLMTFAKILKFYFSNNANMESASLARKNIRLFFQTVFQDSLFLIDATFTFKLSSLSASRIWAFVSMVFVWESIHTLDGFIMLMFSDRLSILKTIFNRIRLSSNQVSSSFDRGATSRRVNDSSTLPGVG